ncbi:MAG: molybdopterin molybdotransferase MoeA [Prochlorococcaceae cyanobacterium ETNP18_MAG_1]|nr:molybdopterin molybdotransferase MoeA [Prochlorococcaceae cyanobacterium ETNP18_MAG_1]
MESRRQPNVSSTDVEPYGQEGLPLKEALQRIQIALLNKRLKRSTDTKAKVSLLDALGRVSAESVHTHEAIPGFRASIMDGYALGQASCPKVGDCWQLVGRSYPGAPFEGELVAGEAIRILTGAVIPKGSEWIVPQELCKLCPPTNTGQDILTLIKQASTNPWIRAENDEFSAGDVVIHQHVRLMPADLARAASCGLTELEVEPKPMIGLLISGDELTPPGIPRASGAIWESNSTLLKTLLARLGYPIAECLVIGDNREALRSSLLELANTCDVVVSTGGVSAGDTDWVRPLVAELGEVDFWKLFLKPGRPFAFGWIGDNVPFFGLPGNPVATAITALQLLWPALQQMEGLIEPIILPRLQVALIDEMQRTPGRPELARARLEIDRDGALQARCNGSQASSRIGSLSGCDLLLEIPAEMADLKPGTKLWAQLLRLPVL